MYEDDSRFQRQCLNPPSCWRSAMALKQAAMLRLTGPADRNEETED